VKGKIRRQKPLKGGRVPTSQGLNPELEAWVKAEARRYGVSRSFVRANCISYASGIAMENYRDMGDGGERRKHQPLKVIYSRRRA